MANINPITLRNDTRQLWENYMISERIKFQNYSGTIVNNYFGRTYDHQEIDWIEERGGKLYAYEFKSNPAKRSKIPVAWKGSYLNSDYTVINPDNYHAWVGS